MKKIPNKFLLSIISCLFSFSFAMLALYLIIPLHYNFQNITFTFIIAFFSGFYLFFKTYQTNWQYLKEHIHLNAILCLLTVIIFLSLYQNKIVFDYNLFKNSSFNPFRIRYYITSFLSLFYLIIYLGNSIKVWLQNFFSKLSKWDKYAYLITSIITMILIVILYNMNNNWFLQYDRVYSMDSGYIFNNIYPNSFYYDIRHPILSIFTFPIFSVVTTIGKFFFDEKILLLISAIIFQIINAQLLILIGLQLKLLIKKKIIFIIYMLSMPTLLYSLFLEKYQIITFLLILYVFTVCEEPEKSPSKIVSATLTMLTSAAIGISEILLPDKIINKLKKIIKIVIITFLTTICLGRAHTLQYGLEEIKVAKEHYNIVQLTFPEKIASTSKMLNHSLVAIPSGIEKVYNHLSYWWHDLESKISPLTIIILIIIFIGIISNFSTLFVKIATFWILFAYFLFVILNWSPHESPLFALYFSWATTPLFVLGIDYLINLIKIPPKVIYPLIIGSMLVINLNTILNIFEFLNTF